MNDEAGADSVNVPQSPEAPRRGPGRPPNALRQPHHASGPETRPPVHEAGHERVRTRSRKSTVSFDDPFYVNLANVPSDVSVEWKRLSNVGEENPFYIAQMREQGWEPVNPQQHPDWVPVPPGYDKTSVIKGGLILMERPMSLTNEARAESKTLAKRQVREAEQRLGLTPHGEMTRQHPGVEPKVTKEFMRPMTIED